MADIELKRAHALGLEGARAAAGKMSEHLARKFALKGRWEGDTLHFDRPGVTGSLAISAKDLHLAVTLGFLLKAMKGSIERAVHEELDKLFTATRPAAAAGAKPKKAPAPKKKGG